MAGNESLGSVTFELLLENDRQLRPARRPRVAIRTVPGSNLVVTNYGGLDPFVLKARLYSPSDGVTTLDSLQTMIGSEYSFTFRGKTGKAILMVLDNPQIEHAGDRLWADVELMMTQW
jgi:hypothetical protein